MKCKDGTCTAKLTLPGNVSIDARGLRGTEAYYRASQLLQTGLAPMKVIFDILNLFIKLRDALMAINLSDLSEFNEKLQDVIVALTKISEYYPSFAVPVMVRDAISYVICLIEMIQYQITKCLALLNKINNISKKLDLDDNLRDVIKLVEQENQKQVAILHCMVGPIQQITDLVNILLNLIGESFNFPTIGEDGMGLEELNEELNSYKTFLQGILDYMEGK